MGLPRPVLCRRPPTAAHWRLTAPGAELAGGAAREAGAKPQMAEGWTPGWVFHQNLLISLALLAAGHLAWHLSNVCSNLHVQRPQGSPPFPKVCRMQDSLFLFPGGNNFLAGFKLEGSPLLLQRVCSTCCRPGWVCALPAFLVQRSAPPRTLGSFWVYLE